MRKQRNNHVYHTVCKRCGVEFETFSNRTHHCPECRPIVDKEKAKERWIRNGRKQTSAKNWIINSETGKKEYHKIGYNQSGENNNNYKNGQSKDWYAEAIKILPEKCNRCGVTNIEYEDPMIIRNLCLHHIDGNHFNNDSSNWEILCKKLSSESSL